LPFSEETVGGITSLQLYSYNGQSITYDAIGNPLTYINGRTFTWVNGRNLATVNQGSKSISYAYNADGLRTSKTVNGVTTEYYWFEGRLLGQKTGNDTILFLYDENGRAYGFVYNGSPYYYFFNVQGDVSYIMGTDGAWRSSYTYDEWGNLLSVTGDTTLANLNPIRYRGYYYDSETGFYCLQSRYYDPEIGRFISPDSTDILTATPMELTDKNLYAYCDNNPITREDKGGQFWNVIAGAAVGALIGVASQAICNLIDGKSIGEGLGKAAITGAIGGALTAAFPGASTLISVGMSATESIISDIQTGENLPTILANATLSAGFAAVTSGGTVFSDKKIVTNTFKAIGEILPGNHPNVKNAAKKFLKKTGKAVWNEIKIGVADGLFVNYVKRGTQWFSGLYTGAKSTYESFA